MKKIFIVLSMFSIGLVSASDGGESNSGSSEQSMSASVRCNYKTHFLQFGPVEDSGARAVRGKKKKTVLIKNVSADTLSDIKTKAISQCRNLKKNGKKIEGSVSGTKGADSKYIFVLNSVDVSFHYDVQVPRKFLINAL